PIAVDLVPDAFSLVPARGGVEEFEMIPFIHLRESRLYGWNRVLKRGFDLLFGAVGLAIVAPVMLAIGVALKLTSPGPVLYQQERMGVDGRRFKMLKFRTMRVNAEEETGPVWARPDDPRRTALGVFLRRTSLDELPQLFNVLRGEMSLVGPRPERPSFVEEFRRRVPGYMLRHKVKGGITGWAQINGWRGNTPIERRIECDLYYIERWSLAFAVWTLVTVLASTRPGESLAASRGLLTLLAFYVVLHTLPDARRAARFASGLLIAIAIVALLSIVQVGFCPTGGTLESSHAAI